MLLGRNPITDKQVERNARNFLHAALKLVPDGMAIFDDLEKNKSIEKTSAWFDAEEFYPRAFTVTPASNRMGLRLQSDPLTLPARELVSEPVCPGAVQVTRDGQCIVLGVDGQTIGGYPKIAQVIQADLHHLGQLRPGNRLRFVPVALADAEAAYREHLAFVREWVMRLRCSLDAVSPCPGRGGD